MAFVSTKACHQLSELTVLFKLDTDFSNALGKELQLSVVPLAPFIDDMMDVWISIACTCNYKAVEHPEMTLTDAQGRRGILYRITFLWPSLELQV